MMKSNTVVLVALFVASASAFAPQLFGVRTEISCFAKHKQKKAAKWAQDKRPKKSRMSDIFRAPIDYPLHSMVKPAEYTVSDEPPVLAAKRTKVASISSEA